MGIMRPDGSFVERLNAPLLSADARERVQAAIAPSRQAIDAHKHAIEDQLRAHGIMQDGDKLTITMGLELEHTSVFGERTARRRLNTLHENGIDQPTDDKAAPWQPETAATEVIAKDLQPGLPSVRHHTRYEAEAPYATCLGARVGVNDTNMLEAYAPSEIISYPLSSPHAAVNWLVAMPQRMLQAAGKYGIRSLDFSTRASDAAPPNSVHMHMALIVHKKDGREINILKAADMGVPTESANQRPSDLGISVAHHLNSLQRDEALLFAPAEKSTDRFSHSIGPKHIGFMPRKKLNDYATSMFRGEGIRAHREEASYGKPDVGPFRIELRVPSSEIIGHPDKERYPQTALFPALAVEQFMRGVREGVDDWAKNPPEQDGYKDRLDALYQERFPLPKSQLRAYKQFESSASAQEYFGDRHSQILGAIEELNHAYETEPRTVTSIAPPFIR